MSEQSRTYIELDDEWRRATPVDVPQRLARDGSLSFKARGIALYILSTGANSADEIAEANDCGRNQIYSGLRELERAGYLTRRRERRAGVVVGSTYVINSNPVVTT